MILYAAIGVPAGSVEQGVVKRIAKSGANGPKIIDSLRRIDAERTAVTGYRDIESIFNARPLDISLDTEHEVIALPIVTNLTAAEPAAGLQALTRPNEAS